MNAISKEIRNMHTVQQLIDKELLNIREVNGIMTLFISFRLHSAMIDDERKLSRWYMRFIMHIGLYTPYQRYKNMLRHILTYINCMRSSKLNFLLLSPTELHKPLQPAYIQYDGE